MAEVSGTAVDLTGAKVHPTATPSQRWPAFGKGPKTVTVDTARGLSIRMPSKAFGRGLSQALASATDAEQRETLEAAAKSAKVPATRDRDTSHYFERTARERFEDANNVSDIGKLLGLPYQGWEPTPGKPNSFHRVTHGGHAVGGPLTASKKDANLVEGAWTVGKSNGSALRTLATYLLGHASGEKALERGERIGLRASPAPQDRDGYDITIYRGIGTKQSKLHFRVESDEGLYATQLNPSYVPASHKTLLNR